MKIASVALALALGMVSLGGCDRDGKADKTPATAVDQKFADVKTMLHRQYLDAQAKKAPPVSTTPTTAPDGATPAPVSAPAPEGPTPEVAPPVE